jgi:hypothetical protein
VGWAFTASLRRPTTSDRRGGYDSLAGIRRIAIAPSVGATLALLLFPAETFWIGLLAVATCIAFATTLAMRRIRSTSG